MWVKVAKQEDGRVLRRGLYMHVNLVMGAVIVRESGVVCGEVT